MQVLKPLAETSKICVAFSLSQQNSSVCFKLGTNQRRKNMIRVKELTKSNEDVEEWQEDSTTSYPSSVCKKANLQHGC